MKSCMNNIFLAGIYILEQIQKAFGTRLASRILSPIPSSHWLIMKKIHQWTKPAALNGWCIKNFCLTTDGVQLSSKVVGYKQNLLYTNIITKLKCSKFISKHSGDSVQTTSSIMEIQSAVRTSNILL